MEGVAVKITCVPWQTVAEGLAATETVAAWPEKTLVTIELDVAGLPVAHGRSDVSLHKTMSPFTGV